MFIERGHSFGLTRRQDGVELFLYCRFYDGEVSLMAGKFLTLCVFRSEVDGCRSFP